MATIDDVAEKLDSITARLEDIEQMVFTPQAIHTLEGLSDIDDNLGLIKSGEFRTGTGTPGKGGGFTGVRMGYPGFIYGTKTYNIAGVDADTLAFGLRTTDGAAVFGGGVDELNQFGIHVYDTDSKPSFIALSADETINSEALGAGDVLIGNNDTDVSNVLWDASAEILYFRQGDLAVAKLASTDGGLGMIGAKVRQSTDADGYQFIGSTYELMPGFLFDFDVVDYDDASFWSSDASGRFTVPAGQGGEYSVGAYVKIIADGGGYTGAAFRVNGVADKAIVMAEDEAHSNHNLSVETPLAAGDYIEVRGWATGSGSDGWYRDTTYRPSYWIRRVR